MKTAPRGHFVRRFPEWLGVAALAAAVAYTSACQARAAALPDLGISFQQPDRPAIVNQSSTLSLIVTNRSEVDATGVTVLFEIPVLSTTFLQASPSFSAPYTMTWSNLTVFAHSALTVTHEIRFKSAGAATINAQVSSKLEDANPDNNKTSATQPILYNLLNQQTANLGYNIYDAVFDERRGELLAIVGGGAFSGELIAMAPESGLVKEHWNIGPGAVRIALGQSGNRAYALTDQGRSLTLLNRDDFAIQKATQVGTINAESDEIYIDPGDSRQVMVQDHGIPGNRYRLYVDGNSTSVEITGRTGYGYSAPNTFLGNFGSTNLVNRFAVSLQGFTQDGSDGAPFSPDLVLSSGRLFSWNGIVYNPRDSFAATVLGIAGYPSFDPETRIVYLTSRSPDTVRMVDLDTRSLLTTQIFSNAYSFFPALAIPMGGDYVGAWIKTSALTRPGVVSIIRNALTGSPPTADVSLTNYPSIGNNTRVSWTLAIVNKGPFPAVDSWVDVELPSGVYLAHLPTERPPAVFNEPNLSYFLGTVPVGTTTLTITVDIPSGTAMSEGLATFRTTSRIIASSNNQTTLLQPGGQLLRTDNLASHPLSQPPTDLAYDPQSNRLYVTVGQGRSGQLIVTDTTGLTVSATGLGGKPDKVVISNGDPYIYVTLAEARKFLRFTKGSLGLDLEITPAFTAQARSNAVLSLVPLPGHPGSVAISQYTPGESITGGVWIYDGAKPRPLFVRGGDAGIRAIQLGRSPDELIGFRSEDGVPMRLSISSEGVVAAPIITEFRAPADQEFYTHGSDILLASGVILNQDDFTVRAFQSTFTPDAVAFSADGSYGILGAKSGNEYLFTDIRPGQTGVGFTLHSHITNSPIQKLISWGDGNVAFVTENLLVTGPVNLGDSNQDGIPDWWAIAHGFSRNFPLTNDDTDGDGVTTLMEYLSGTDPRNDKSIPKMVLYRRDNGTVRLNFDVLTDQRFTVERATHLELGDWTPILNGVSTGGTQVVEDSPTGNTAFYRILFQP
jgi:hypothetical protein